MNTKRIAIVLAAALAAATAVSCYRPYGYHLYPQTPRFAPTNPAEVRLLRGDPKRDHIRLGEVWIRPSRYADRYWVESILREKAADLGADALVIVADRYLRGHVVYNYWYGPRRVVRRQIVGIAIRYRR